MSFTLDELNALTRTYVLGKPVDIYFHSHPLLYKLMSTKRLVPGGKKIDQPLEVGEANTGVYGNTTVIPTTGTETHNKAQYDWGGYFGAQTIDLATRIENNGDAAIVNLVASKFDNMQKSVRKKMAKGIRLHDVVNNVLGFQGLALLFDTTATTEYGGITANQYSIWAANNSSVATDATYAGFQAIRRPAITDTNAEGTPDLYLTTIDIKDAFTASLQSQVRYQDSKMVDAGFQNILFDGAPVIADLGQDDYYVDALNTRHLQFVSHTDFDFTTPVWEADRKQPDIWTSSIRWIGQLTCSNRAAHSRFTQVNAS